MRMSGLGLMVGLAMLGLTGCSVTEFSLVLSFGADGAVSVNWVDWWRGPKPPCDQAATERIDWGREQEWLAGQEFDGEFSLWLEPGAREYMDCAVNREATFASINDWNAYASALRGHIEQDSGTHATSPFAHLPVMGNIRTEELTNGATRLSLGMSLARGKLAEHGHIPAWSWGGGVYTIVVELPCTIASITPNYRSEISKEHSGKAVFTVQEGLFSWLPRALSLTTTPGCDFKSAPSPLP